MKGHEIADYPEQVRHGQEWLDLLSNQNHWLRELAYQFATFNDILSSDVTFKVRVIHESADGHGLEQHEEIMAAFRELKQLFNERENRIMELTAEQSKAIQDALDALGVQINTAVLDAANQETKQIIAALQKLQTQNGPITPAALAEIISMVSASAPAIASTAKANIDKISVDSGADKVTGTVQNPPDTGGPATA